MVLWNLESNSAELTYVAAMVSSTLVVPNQLQHSGIQNMVVLSEFHQMT